MLGVALSLWADDRDVVSRRGQRLALQPDATVEGDRQVLDDDQNPWSCTRLAPRRSHRPPDSLVAGQSFDVGAEPPMQVEDPWQAVPRSSSSTTSGSDVATTAASQPCSASLGRGSEQSAQMRKAAFDVAQVGAHQALRD